MSTNVGVGTNEVGGGWWVLALGGIALWFVHVLAEIALVRVSQQHHWVLWLMDALTLVLAVATALMALACRRLLASTDATESSTTVAGRAAFVAWLGLFIGLTSVLLIVVEGVFIVAIGSNG